MLVYLWEGPCAGQIFEVLGSVETIEVPVPATRPANFTQEEWVRVIQTEPETATYRKGQFCFALTDEGMLPATQFDHVPTPFHAPVNYHCAGDFAALERESLERARRIMESLQVPKELIHGEPGHFNYPHLFGLQPPGAHYSTDSLVADPDKTEPPLTLEDLKDSMKKVADTLKKLDPERRKKRK